MKTEETFIFCGRTVIEKKNKETGQKTGEKSILYKLLSVDLKNNTADLLSFFVKPEDEDKFSFKEDLKVLTKVKATIELSLTSSFKSLLDIKNV